MNHTPAVEKVTIFPRARIGSGSSSISERRWRTLAYSFLAVWLVLNLLTASRSPTVWQDEVQFADPAINLVQGRGFTSTAWAFQPESRVFAANAPVYPLILSAWLKVWGVSPTAVRSLNFVLSILGVLSVWRVLDVCAMRRPWLAKLLFAAAFLGGYATAFSFRSGRYDMLGFFLVATLAAVGTIESRVVRRSLLFLVAMFVIPAGLQLAPLFAAGVTAVLVLQRGRRLADLVTACLGGMAGALVWLGWLHVNGMLPTLLSSVSGLSAAAGGVLARVLVLKGAFVADPSTVCLMAVATLVWFSQPRDGVLRRLGLGSMVAGGFVIVFVSLAGKYPVYYGWMGYLPMVFGVVRILDRWFEIRFRSVRFVAIGLVCCAALPFWLRLAVAAREWRERDYEPVAVKVQEALRTDDVAFVTPPAYYAAKARAHRVFVSTHGAFAAEECEALTVMIVNRTEIAKAIAQVGGSWNEVAQVRSSGARGRVGSAALYDLSVLRRSVSVTSGE